MSKYKVTVTTEKCLGYGACEKAAPGAFKVGAAGVVELVDLETEGDETLLRAARGCPYKVIAVVDPDTGQQLHPRVRK